MPNKNQTTPKHLDKQTFPTGCAPYYAATVRKYAFGLGSFEEVLWI
jgi:hypothetical protein